MISGLSTLQKSLLSVVAISAAVGLFGDKDNITEGFLDTFFGKRTLQLWSILLFFHCIFDQTDDPANTCMGLYFANSIIKSYNFEILCHCERCASSSLCRSLSSFHWDLIEGFMSHTDCTYCENQRHSESNQSVSQNIYTCSLFFTQFILESIRLCSLTKQSL